VEILYIDVEFMDEVDFNLHLTNVSFWKGSLMAKMPKDSSYSNGSKFILVIAIGGEGIVVMAHLVSTILTCF
jgi:hypothetical protein